MGKNINMNIPFGTTWERVKCLTGWKRATELAAFLSINPATISQAKKRDSFPLVWVYKIASKHRGRLDWLVKGEMPMLSLSLRSGMDDLTIYSARKAATLRRKSMEHHDVVNENKDYFSADLTAAENDEEEAGVDELTSLKFQVERLNLQLEISDMRTQLAEKNAVIALLEGRLERMDEQVKTAESERLELLARIAKIEKTQGGDV